MTNDAYDSKESGNDRFYKMLKAVFSLDICERNYTVLFVISLLFQYEKETEANSDTACVFRGTPK